MVDAGRMPCSSRYASRRRRPWLPAARRSSGSRRIRSVSGALLALDPRPDPQEGLREERPFAEPFVRFERGDDREVDLSAQNRTRRVERVHRGDLEAKRSLVGEKLANDRQKQPLAQVVARCDPQRGDRIAGEPGEKAEERVRLVEHTVDGEERRLAVRAQADPAPFALEQLDPEVLFDSPQLLAHRRRCLVQLPRGRAHRAGARDQEHVLQRRDRESDRS